jgi:tetratricopeptide (TPR) repeat protein
MIQVADGLSTSARALLVRPSDVSLRRIWLALEPAARQAAVLAALGDEDSLVESWARHEVARARRFRPRTVAHWDAHRLAEAAGFLVPEDPTILGELVRRVHVDGRAAMLAAYLDALGIPHQQGVIADGVSPAADSEAAEEGAAALLRSFPADHVLLYLLTLRVLNPLLVLEIDDWLPRLFGPGEGTSPPRSGPGEEVQPEEEAPSPEETDEFTTLDRQMVRSIVDSAQGVEGALSPDELLDMVHELVGLSSARHRSFFHLGFAEVVLEMEPCESLPAQNLSRLRWYWSGRVNGLARIEDWQGIVESYDAEPVVRRLGEDSLGPCSTAAPLVFEALCRKGRASEGAQFLSVQALVGAPALTAMVHEQGRDLLWQDRALEARGMMDLLGALLEALEDAGYSTRTEFLLEVRRRRAHCYRELGELPKARRILGELLELEADPEVRAMARADLGLIDGGFRSLGRVRLPEDESQLVDVQQALERGEDAFQEGAGLEVRYSAHGRYCLGVLALTREQWENARANLELALSVFEAEPVRYGVGDLISRTRLYLGMAIALELDAVRSERAADLLVDALSRGARIPPYLVARTIESLDLGSSRQAKRLAEHLLRYAPGRLDLLLETEVLGRSEILLDALLARAGDVERAPSLRTADYRRALPHVLASGNRQRGGAILDALEAFAREGVAREEFVELLESPENTEPAWSAEEVRWAQIQLHRLAGEYEPALAKLERHFYQVLNGTRYDALVEAEGVLETIRELGAEKAQVDPLEAALAARVGGDGDAWTEGEELPPVRVLFIGGDERQRDATVRVRRELKELHPKLHVDFVHPGWGSNWGAELDGIVERLPGYHAVVIMRFIRTEFGKKLRKALDVPWTHCAGAGRATIRRSVIRAAQWGRDHLESES